MATIRPDSEVRLIKNVPFNYSYKNVVQFSSRSAQESYFKGLENIALDNFKYVRNNGSLKVPYLKDEILEYNYLMFKNNAYGDRYFYAFITNINYINPNTSEVVFDLDIFQTWFMDVSFLPCYIEREHCQRWNSDGSPVINTIPEDLDYGSEYEFKGIRRMYDVDTRAKIKWLVLCYALDKDDFVNEDKAELLLSNAGLYENLTFVAMPLTEMGIASGGFTINGNSGGDASGMSDYVDNLINLLRYSTRFVNKLVSFYVTDFLPVSYSVEITDSGHIGITSEQFYICSLNEDEEGTTFYLPFVSGYVNSSTIYVTHSYTFNNKYEYLTSGITESKLLMYPYSYNILTDLQGDNFIIKNEYVDDDYIQIGVKASMGTGNKVAYRVSNYLGADTGELYLDNGIINCNDTGLTVIDDYTAAYLQGNSNTLKQSVLATQQTSALNNTIAQNNASTASKVAYLQNVGTMANSAVNAVTGIYTGIAQGAGGNNAGAVNSIANAGGSIVSGAINSLVNWGTTEIQNENTINNTALQGELANQQAQESALAKVQDARNTADNVTLQGGSANFNYGYKNMSVKIIAKQITQEYIDILQDYFQKYGYKVHRVKTPNIHTRQSWNYVQTVGCLVQGNIPQMYIEAIETMFNNGITIWHTTDVGNYSLNNDEI